MKLIQTFWSLPSLTTTTEGQVENRFGGGWSTERNHAMSWALSCMKWKTYYPDLTLYTDRQGMDWLINKLQLPYPNVRMQLDQLDHYNPMLWAMPKLFVYSQQTEPFIHCDGDTYIWARLPRELEQQPLICQSIEHNYTYYKKILNEMYEGLPFIPEVLRVNTDEPILSANAGILGGHDIGFIQELCRQAFDFVHRNEAELPSISMGILNVVIEQFFFYRLAMQQNKKISILLDNVEESFSSLLRLNTVPILSKYVHAISFSKKSKHISHQIEERLKYEYPRIYHHVDGQYRLPPVNVAVNGLRDNDMPHTRTLVKRLQPGITLPLQHDPLCDQIEQLIADNYEDRQYKLLLDIYQIEKFMYDTAAFLISDEFSWQDKHKTYSLLYKITPEELLDSPFTLRPEHCRIAWLNHFIEIDNLDTEMSDIANGLKDPEPRDTPVGLMLYLYQQRVRCFFLLQWSAFLELFEGTTMTGNELITWIQSEKNTSFHYKGADIHRSVVEFLMTHLLDPACLKPADPVPPSLSIPAMDSMALDI